MKGRGSHSFLDVERELINAEVLSGGSAEWQNRWAPVPASN